MLRLIGLIVVVLFVLSLAHGERRGSYANVGAQADTVVDELTGQLAEGMRILGTTLFGPGPAARPAEPREWAQAFDDAMRTGDPRSRRPLAATVLQACPALGLVCRQSGASIGISDPARPDRRPLWDDSR